MLSKSHSDVSQPEDDEHGARPTTPLPTLQPTTSPILGAQDHPTIGAPMIFTQGQFIGMRIRVELHELQPAGVGRKRVFHFAEPCPSKANAGDMMQIYSDGSQTARSTTNRSVSHFSCSGPSYRRWDIGRGGARLRVRLPVLLLRLGTRSFDVL
jgi:hypothetical protein